MKKCWKSKPADRPTFSELVTSIEGLADNLTGYITPMSELILNRGIELTLLLSSFCCLESEKHKEGIRVFVMRTI